jgi:hypothetical protein
MGLTEMIFTQRPAEIGLVVLDASVTEVHSARATVTRHPVEAEQGTQSAVSDNVQVDPLTVQIDGVVTNHPLENFAERLAFGDRSETQDVQAHLELLTTLLTGTLITIRTTLLTYEDMVLEQLSVTRDKEKGNALHLSATATQVRLVTLEETESQAKPLSTKNAGKQGAVPAEPEIEAESTSLLHKGLL